MRTLAAMRHREQESIETDVRACQPASCQAGQPVSQASQLFFQPCEQAQESETEPAAQHRPCRPWRHHCCHVLYTIAGMRDNTGSHEMPQKEEKMQEKKKTGKTREEETGVCFGASSSSPPLLFIDVSQTRKALFCVEWQ